MSWNWDRLRVFFEVVECGTFTAAAKRLKLSQPAVSRQISTLEEELGVVLFHRDYKGLVLTEIGEEVFKTSACLKAEVDIMESRIANNQDAPVGPLRLTTSVAFGAAWLSPLMGSFHQEFPDVKISLLLSDHHEMNLSTREADVAIRFAPQTKPCLIQKKLMDLRYNLYASQSYLDRNGTPKTITDLKDHDIIVYGSDVPAPVTNINWILELIRKDHAKFEPALSVANVHGIHHAIRSGAGIGALPNYLIDDDDNLIEVMPKCSGPEIEVYFVYLEEMRNAKRLNVLRDFLVKHAEPNKLT
tara:strand:+ start:2443 stop:3345 length:903 start_codon:yes stop_codon:yes gene_type:complete